MGMLIEQNSKFFGLDAKVARDFIKLLHKKTFDIESPCFHKRAIPYIIRELILNEDKQADQYDHLYLTSLRKKLDEQAQAMTPILISRMIEEGFITTLEDDHFELSDKAVALSRHKFIKRLPRARATQMLAELLDRVTEWNAVQPYVWIQNIWLYGSMLTDSADVGDIDLVIEFQDNMDSPHALSTNQVVTMFVYGMDHHAAAKAHLKNRSPYFSFDGFFISDLDLIRDGYRQIVKDRQVIVDIPCAHSTPPTKVKRNTPPTKESWFYLGNLIKPAKTCLGMSFKEAHDLMAALKYKHKITTPTEFSSNYFEYITEKHFFKNIKCELGRHPLTFNKYKNSEELLNTLSARIIKEGIAIKHPYNYFELTEKGEQLMFSKLRKTLTHAKASKVLDAFLARVIELNSSDSIIVVNHVWMFGAMINNADEIGDIEIVLQLTANPNIHFPPANNHSENRQRWHAQELRSNEILKLLCYRLPRISINNYSSDELQHIQGGFIQIVKDRDVIYQQP
ncbi:hypothetical protein D3C87_703240 [compost metagenome]